MNNTRLYNRSCHNSTPLPALLNPTWPNLCQATICASTMIYMPFHKLKSGTTFQHVLPHPFHQPTQTFATVDSALRIPNCSHSGSDGTPSRQSPSRLSAEDLHLACLVQHGKDQHASTAVPFVIVGSFIPEHDFYCYCHFRC